MVSSSNLNTLAGYVLIAALGVGVYVLQRPKRPAPAIVKGQPEPAKEKASKKKERAEKARQEAKEKPRDDPPTYQFATGQRDSTADEVNNKEFAQQFANVQRGTTFESKSNKEQKRQKSIKQNRAEVNTFNEDDKVSVPSSTAGNDADDDQSPANSPRVAAAGDISDMLEAPAAGPTSLRLVETDSGKLKQQPKKESKPKEQPLTKKQRQNRKKAEAEKAQRQADEQERKVKEEAQRRAARVAEGRLAKDGSQYTNAAVNGSKSAWTNKTSDPKAAPAPTSTQPLDTFDTEPAASAPAPSQPAKKDWIESVPSEETQMEMIQEDEWKPVPSKNKKNKKTTTGLDSADEANGLASIHQAPIPKSVLAPQKQYGGPGATNGKPKLTSGGSFAALSTEDPEEEEWDV